MGLFSFLKNAGSKIFNNAEKEAPKAETAEATAEKLRQHKAMLLRSVVDSLGIEVNNLSIDLQDATVFLSGEVQSQADKEKVILAVGNVNGVEAVNDDGFIVNEPAPVAEFYEVQKGDTLSKIAKSFYGDWRKYTDIFEANKPMLKDPDLIYPGQNLRIQNPELYTKNQ